MCKISRRHFIAAVPALGATSNLVSAAVPGSLPNQSDRHGRSARLQAAIFTCDVTPPVGSPITNSNPPVATSADIPLLAKGLVIDDGTTRYALCAFDYCGLRNGAHDLLRRAIANALGVNELQIEVHCLHPHDAPVYDTTAEMLVQMVLSPPHITDLAFIAVARRPLRLQKACFRIAKQLDNYPPFAEDRRTSYPDFAELRHLLWQALPDLRYCFAASGGNL